MRLGSDLQQAVTLLGIGRHAGIGHGVHFPGKDIVHRALADAEDVDGVGDDLLVRQLAEIRYRALFEHDAALLRRPRQHDDDLAVLLEGAAGRGARGVMEHGAALGQQRLTEIVVRQLLAEMYIVIERVHLALVLDELHVEGTGEDLLGQVVAGRAEAAGGNDDVGALARDFHTFLQPLRVIADDGVIQHVDADLRQQLRHVARVGIRDVAEQQLGSHGNYLGIIGLTHV